MHDERVAGTTRRALALLDLLQTRRTWSGPDLAGRLGVTVRTLRRDVERLRDLGYDVVSARGTFGGYRLAAGSTLPPLLLTDDEAVTVAVGLRTVATQALVDGEHTTLTALAKLEQVLPAPLRRRVAALAEVQPQPSRTPPVAAGLLAELALACRDGERVRFRYVSAIAEQTDRTVEPRALVASQRAWFLVAWDRGRAGWRTFRVDRVSRLLRLGARDPAREVPGGDAAAFVARAVAGRAGARPRVEVVVDLPVDVLRARVGAWADDAVALEETTTSWPLGDASPASVLTALAWLPAEARVELRGDEDALARVATVAARVHAVVLARTPG